MKIFVVAALHGDEPFGLKIIDELRRSNIKGIITQVGHPEAIAKGKRFLDQDLNRSFNSRNRSIEVAIARNIKKEIEEHKADIILDIHTSVSDVGKIAIVARDYPLTKRIAGLLGMEAIVVIPKRLVDKSLIGCFPDKSISLEFGKTRLTDELAADIASKIKTLKLSHIQPAKQLPVFEVFAEIDKDFKGLENIKNLIFNKGLNGYPFLAGIDTYETIGGFLAKKIKT
jgi:succinylglutamate desuccinylase